MIVNTVGPAGAEIMLVGEAPGEQEDRLGVPFVGTAGRTLDILLQQAGINRHQALITNVARVRPPANDMSFYFFDKKKTKPKPQLEEWLQQLKSDIIQHKPNIVVALGDTALWALTGEHGINANRGWISESTLVPGQKILATFHPQNINYEWKNSWAMVMDLRKAKRHSTFSGFLSDRRTLIPEATAEQFIDYCKRLADSECVVGIDLETVSNFCHPDRIGIGHSFEYAMSLPLVRSPHHYWSTTEEIEIWSQFSRVMQRCPIVVQNGPFDFSVLFNHLGIFPRRIEMDTHIAAHVCWPEVPRSLSFLSSICIDVPRWKHTAMSDPGAYNAQDVSNMMGVYEVLKKELENANSVDTFKFELSQIEPACFLQLQGILIDNSRRLRMMEEFSSRVADIDNLFETLTGKKINLRSSAQVKKLLYVDLGLPPQYKRRKHADEPPKLTADAEAIKKLLRLYPNNQILTLFAEYAKLSKLLSSFLDIQLSPAGRVHTSYNVTGATMRRKDTKGLVRDDEEQYKSFGRWSSSQSIVLPYGSGNLQNIPYKARKLYIPPPGYVIVQADYKQAEAVVVSYLIGDEILKRMFVQSFGKSKEECKANHWDVHKLTAAMLYNKPVEDVTPEERNIGKRLRHAVSYSAGPQVIAVNIGVALQEAKALLNHYHAVNPRLGAWQERVKKQLAETRTLTNLLGRKHRFLDKWDDSLFRSAYSFLPQSTVGDLLNLSLVTFYNRYGDEETILLQLHDAIYTFCLPSETDRTMERLRSCMIRPIEVGSEIMTIDVDFSIGKNWGEMEEI